MAAYQTINVEYEDHDITVDLSTHMVWDDYGVPGSPRWLSPTEIMWSNYDVDGKQYTPTQLEDFLGKKASSAGGEDDQEGEIIAEADASKITDLAEEIDDLILSASEDTDWEEEEPDYDDRRYDDDY